MYGYTFADTDRLWTMNHIKWLLVFSMTSSTVTTLRSKFSLSSSSCADFYLDPLMMIHLGCPPGLSHHVKKVCPECFFTCFVDCWQPVVAHYNSTTLYLKNTKVFFSFFFSFCIIFYGMVWYNSKSMYNSTGPRTLSLLDKIWRDICQRADWV